MGGKFELKRGKTFEIAELPDEALEAIVGGTGQEDDFVCQCAECKQILVGEAAFIYHAETTNHGTYHWV